MEKREARKLREIVHKFEDERYRVFWDRPGFKKPRRIGLYTPDIVAVKGDETIIVEVKTRDALKEQRDKVEFLANYAHREPNVRFDLVLTNPRRKTKIEYDEIEDILFKYFFERTIPEIDIIATHTWVEEVSDVNIYNVAIKEDCILVKGEGWISVEYQYGSDADVREDMGLVGSTAFPFDFEVCIDREQNATEISWVEVNTKSWWE